MFNNFAVKLNASINIHFLQDNLDAIYRYEKMVKERIKEYIFRIGS